MAELTAADVSAFTGGRLADDGGDGEVTRALKAALAAARGDSGAGWHVSPVRAETLIVDGPGGRKLRLKTRKIVSISSIEENGEILDPSSYVVSADVPGLIIRRRGSWTCELAGIAITWEHGFAEDEAADWRQAILTMVDQMSLVPVGQSGRSSMDLTRKRIDDVEYQWSDGKLAALAGDALFSVASIINSYSLKPVYFA
ncbi:head-to-tail connector complex protein [Mycobacterium phage MooMoo]|uniref:Head-to-tail connector complex protein n=1 Tax=Mycobacterium phage MooMoo TaxID=2108127 RepID=A0A2P1JR66_9CAUD|nr:head-to-tail connector complex protein [Mycobacterium phage MooMoo]AVO21613.1 head-to-tail connector complex protein [Mycobacterium phage MooMoo]